MVLSDVETIYDQVSPIRRRLQIYNTQIVTVRYTYEDDSIEYNDALMLPSTGDTWKHIDMSIYYPSNIKSITVFHQIGYKR